jgi:putative tryptophan/tyrosine transport system substrate-binding protein
VRRREFIILLGGAAAAWPLAATAQQAAIPVVGFLGAPSPGVYAQYTAAIRQGLRESGFVEGQNVAIEYRWAEGQFDRLPGLAMDLVRQRVAAIVTIGGTPAVVAAKAATSTIPIVFMVAADPVQLGLVAGFNRPGGNVTGVAMMGIELESKRLELLREVVPKAALIAMLVNPTNPQVEIQSRGMQEAAYTIGQQVDLLNASSESEIEAAFARSVQRRAGALLVGQDTFLFSQRELLVALMQRHRMPAITPWRECVALGGLMSYGADLKDSYRQTGLYVGHVLRGAKPGDLPVMQPTKFQFVLNLKTAKALELDIPLKLHAFADEVIE